MIGQVYKIHTDSYVVCTDDGAVKTGARGVLRRSDNKIVVGDFVEFEDGVIYKVLPRKNYFPRPNVANIDVVAIVVSPEPKPDFKLIDKLVINAVSRNLEIVFAVNKSDVSDLLFDELKAEYRNVGADFYKVSANKCTGLKEFGARIEGKLVLFAGQSAAGKTSLVNSLFGLELKTGVLSDKIQRGRHTTTYSEIHKLFSTRIIDTPGFAAIDADIESDALPDCYPEYFARLPECKYRGCKHINEPDCAVKRDVELGLLSKDRYLRYVEIYNEITEKEKYNENR